MKNWILSLKVLALSCAFVVTSCGNQGDSLPNLPGVKGPIFNVIGGKIMITINLLNVSLPVGGKIPVPYTRDSSFEVAPNIVDGGTTLQFLLDPAEIKGVTVGSDPHTLPDGRPLPGVPGGTLPSLRVDTQLFNTSFYFAKTLFGFFVPFKLDTRGFGAYYTIKLNGLDAGLLGLVSSDPQGNNSGLVIFLKLDALKSRQLQKLIDMSERNPHMLY
jgi:hypothetical protein